MGKLTKKTLAVLLALAFCLSLLPLGALADDQYNTAFLVYDDNVWDEDEVITGIPEGESMEDDDGDGKITFTISTATPERGGGADYVFLGWSNESGDWWNSTVDFGPGDTIVVAVGEPKTLYAVWGPKTAKALIYDANLPYDVKYDSDTVRSNHMYYRFSPADHSDNEIEQYYYDQTEWTLVYHLPGDTGYLPILQGQDDLYISLSEWSNYLEGNVAGYDPEHFYYSTSIFWCDAYNHNSYNEYNFDDTYNSDVGEYYDLSGMPMPTAYDNYGPVKITVTDQTPTLTGYTFKGWSEQPGDYNEVISVNSFELQPNQSKVLYAVWEKTEYEYGDSGYVTAKPIIYDANVPSELLKDRQDANSPYLYYQCGDFFYPYDGTSPEYFYTKPQHSVDVPSAWGLVYREEWDTGFVPIYQGQGKKYVPLSGVADEIYEASHDFCYDDMHYNDHLGYYYVQYNLPVELSNVPSPTVVENRLKYSTVSVSTDVPTLEGYVFKGWSEDPGDDNTVNADDSYYIEENMGIVLYAVWEKAGAPTTSYLIYDDNVADEEIAVPVDDSQTNTDDPKTFDVSTDKPVREGYVFLGWSTASGENNTVDVGATIDVPAGQTKTIYAVWQAKQAITIKAKSQTWPYDGSDHSLDEWEITAGSLLADDELTVVITGTVHDVDDTAEGNNVVSSVTVKRGDEDVSEYYTITTVNGTLTIEPKPLTIYTPSAEKYYDGKPFESGPNSPIHADIGGLVDGETVGLFFPGERYFQVGEYPNAVEVTFADGVSYFYERSFTLEAKLAMTAAARAVYIAGEREGLTAATRSADIVRDRATTLAKASNYIVVSASIGTLRILPFGVPETPAITIKAASAEKTYDGKPLTKDEFTVDGLPSGYTVEAVIDGSQTVVGTIDNVIVSYVVKDKLGIDKTSSFNVTTEKGTLKVNPAPLTITADSAAKLYDGTPLTKDSFTNTALAEGDTISSVTVTGSQTEVGSSANVPSDAKIINAGGEDVTACYDVKYVNGTLKVTDSSEDLDDPDTPLHGEEEVVEAEEPDDDLYTGTVPLTGDESNVPFWIALAALALAGLVSQLAGRKRGKSAR
ncbi:MAG: InlB B-repeat-containing protein [Oscillospiraceae bacterium]|nr:InlB B-repeat-containing protein [Oscillospiraceae bacterium]